MSTMAGLQEINSFVNKFVSLCNRGIKAKLSMETEAGKVSVDLHATLGPCHVPEYPDGGHRVGGSRLRRRERRAAARQLAGAEQVAQSGEVREKTEEAVKAAQEVVTAEEANESVVEEPSKVTEEGDTSVYDDSDAIAEKASTSIKEMDDKDDSDCDIYVFRYWNNLNTSKAQDALDYIEKTLKQKFKNNKVKVSDQIYKVHAIENLDDNEIEVKVKLKKNNCPV